MQDDQKTHILARRWNKRFSGVRLGVIEKAQDSFQWPHSHRIGRSEGRRNDMYVQRENTQVAGLGRLGICVEI